jgi:hypothetical protein
MICSLNHIKYLCEYAHKNNFSFPENAKGKSFHWLQKHYNGIGAEWMSPRIRKLATICLRHMEAESMYHDVEFLQKNKSFWNFTKANLRLFYNGIKARHFFSGLTMAIICEFFGWSAWKEGKETMAYCYYLEEEKK